ncbi:hypothetical protein [Parabacteroides sp. AM08-6]|uniref:hypothetical protein n=1 Tax=Parabacteroides sp. AM08-6 TaxID=2292053 RepID=UPI000EFFA384|nr:hypothetical protein [Parabacteroides sp. AM08-6]RHJ78690.1 hypothetical protein DW103_14465 [Parabacteroides sp. AM08-6]
MKRYCLILTALLVVTAGYAQKKNFSYKFYGQVRGDLFYNSRANAEIVDGLFHLYPKDVNPDADGNDLNATANGSFYLLYSRLGVDIKGPNIGKAVTTAKLEGDFRGAGSNWAVLRVRHAYVNLDWGKSAVLVGQTWHPLFGDVFPQMLNLSTGAPFNPFNRSPMLRYRYTNKNVQLTAAAIWQLQYLSAGPNGKSEEYIKNSCIPEFYVGADYKDRNWITGIGMEVLSLKPRLQTTIGDQVYKVNERVTSLSFEAHVRYTDSNWLVQAKTLLASNLTQACMLGGYGVTSVNARTGEQEYTPFRHSMSWVNVVYGKKWKPGIFLGYLKNLGTGKSITGTTYGVGLDVDQVFTTNLQLSYNLPHWKLGMEYSPSWAWYGDKEGDKGKITNTHSVANHRVLGVVMYMF